MMKSKKILNIFTVVVLLLLVGCTIAAYAIRAVTQPKVETIDPEYEYFVSEDGPEMFYLYTLPANTVREDGDGTFVWVTHGSLGVFGTEYTAERVGVAVFGDTPDGVTVTSDRLNRWDEVVFSPDGRISDGGALRKVG